MTHRLVLSSVSCILALALVPTQCLASTSSDSDSNRDKTEILVKQEKLTRITFFHPDDGTTEEFTEFSWRKIGNPLYRRTDGFIHLRKVYDVLLANDRRKYSCTFWASKWMESRKMLRLTEVGGKDFLDIEYNGSHGSNFKTGDSLQRGNYNGSGGRQNRCTKHQKEVTKLQKQLKAQEQKIRSLENTIYGMETAASIMSLSNKTYKGRLQKKGKQLQAKNQHIENLKQTVYKWIHKKLDAQENEAELEHLIEELEEKLAEQLRRQDLNGPEKTFTCPITLQIMRYPVITASGQTYEYCAIREALRKGLKDPLTRMPLQNTTIVSNLRLRDAIGKWLENNPEKKRELYPDYETPPFRLTVEAEVPAV